MTRKAEPAEARLDFRSKEEFRLACRALGQRMHYLNRVAMGEDRFAWEVADMIQRLGRVFDAHYKHEETAAAFGDGWTASPLTQAERRARLFKLLYDEAT